MFYNHPGFVEANVERVAEALGQVPDHRRAGAHLAFTAHSIPLAMAKQSRYEAQLAEAARLVAEQVEVADHAVVYQSRSGSPKVPWLEPDVCDHIRALAGRGVSDLVLSPIGFVSDHMEILFDLDVEAREAAEESGVELIRAQTAGIHPAFVSMIRELIQERLDPSVPRRAHGRYGPGHDICQPGCCLASL
jgi:ferrochelatase